MPLDAAEVAGAAHPAVTTADPSAGAEERLLAELADARLLQRFSAERRHRSLIGLLPVGVYACEAPSGVITFWNERAAQLWGRTPNLGDTDERFCGSLRLWRPDGTLLPHDETPMAIAIREKRAFRNEEVIIERPDGSRITALVNIDPVLDSNGTVVAAINVFHDTTALKQAEEGLRRAMEFDEAVMSSMNEGLYTLDENGLVTSMNPAAERLFGWTFSELRGRKMHDVTHHKHPDGSPFAAEECPGLQVLREGKALTHHEDAFIHKDGSFFDVEYSASPIRAAGRIAGVAVVFRDVSERKRAEALLACQKDALEMLAAGVPLMRVLEFLANAVQRRSQQGVLVAIHLLDESGTRFAETAAPGLPASYAQAVDGMEVSSGAGPCCAAICARQPVMIADVAASREFAAFASFALPLGIHSGWSVPIFSSTGQVLGTVAHYYREVRQPHPQDHLLGEIVTRTAAVIIERKQVEEALRRSEAQERVARMEAEAANRSKDVFLATLSHEVRTPLSAMLGWATILRKKQCTAEEIQEGLEVIERNCRAQAQLIEDVLEVSRIVSGKLRLDIKPCDLASVVYAAIDVVRAAADAKQIELIPQIDPHAGPVACDDVRMQQVVWNLLSNAIKFTPRGGTVRVTLDREDAHARIVVSDTGQGIRADLLPHVFDRFWQADGSTRRRSGGLGLGLSIVKHIVELHGGSVHAQSDGEERGATFTVQLPIRTIGNSIDAAEERGPELPRPSAELAPSWTPAPQEPALRLDGLHILVVDDEADARRLVGKVLTDLGAEATLAGSVREAMAALERRTPDVLVSDLAMSEEDGFDLLRRVRGAGHTAQQLPAIALTAYAHKSYAHSALLGGFQAHVPKPIDLAELSVVIASLAGRTGRSPSPLASQD